MPLHFEDLDVVSQAAGLNSALIVPCNMCPAVTVAVRENRPFIQFFRGFLKSAPFENYLRKLQSRLAEEGVRTKVFRNRLYHHWFVCMWSSSRRKKLREHARRYEAVIVMGCESANEIVRDLAESTDCRVIEGMKAVGIMNARLRFHLPCNISFEDCRIIPISQQ